MVHEDVADKFFAMCKKYVKEFYGESAQKSEWFGRCINGGACSRLKTLMEQSKGKVVVGGSFDEADKYIEPTVFDYGSNLDEFVKSPIMQDEIFGPLLPCVRYKDLNNCIDLIRNLNTGKPLALYCFATDANVIQQVKTRTTSGGLVINDCLMHLANHELPFGGVGNSGMGAYHGERSFNAFTHEKAVLEKSAGLDQSIAFKLLLDCRFPPYTPFKATMVKMFSLSWVGTAVNVPIPVVRAGVKLLMLYGAFTMLGFTINHEHTELTRYLRFLLGGGNDL